MSVKTELSYPVVSNPGFYRKSKKITTKPEPHYQNVQNGGVYNWISSETLKYPERSKIDHITTALRIKKEDELATLSQKLHPKQVSLEEKVRINRSTAQDGVQMKRKLTEGQVVDASIDKQDTEKPRKNRQKLPFPIGFWKYESLRTDQTSAELPEAKNRSIIDPLDSSLVIQDVKGREIMKRLKRRVMQINDISANGAIKQQTSVPVRLSTEMKQRLIEPGTLQYIVKEATRKLSKSPPFKDINIERCSLDYKVIASRMNLKSKLNTSKFTPKEDHCLILFNLSKSKDKTKGNCSRGIKKIEKTFDNRESLGVKDENSSKQIEASRLPYLYICPSI